MTAPEMPSHPQIGLVLHPRRDPGEVAGTIVGWARSHGAEVLVRADDADRVPDGVRAVPEAEVAASADALVSLGGDGTMLGALRLAAARPVPVLGVNLGHLGFLVEVEPAELGGALDRLGMGDFEIEDHPAVVLSAGGEEMVGGVPPLVAYAKRLDREATPGTRRKYQTIDADMLGIVLSRALKGRTLADYISQKIWQPFGMEADASWLVDKAGIERGGCCLNITLRDYARLGMFMDEGAQAGGVEVLADGWIHEAWTPQPSEPNKYTIGYGYYWQIRQDGGYEAVGAYGQSVTIYPKEHLVVAVNSASVDHHGIGLARWDLIAAIRGAVR